MEFLTIIDNTLNQSLIYCFLALSVYISLRLIDFPDLSIEGTFPMGAAIAAIVAKSSGLMGLSIPIAVLGGFIIGMITASLHIYLKIGKLLSGILIAVGLYSINFRIMGAKANLYLSAKENLFSPLRKIDTSWTNHIFGNDAPVLLYPFSNLFFSIILIIILFLLYRFFKTGTGSLIRYSRSDTKYFLESIGVNYKVYVIFGLGLANAFAALSGALVAFQSGSASTTLGFGIILVALVSLVVGEQIVKLFHKDLTDLFPTILTPIIGTFVYYLIIWFVRWVNTKWQMFAGYPDASDQFQFFNSDIRILSVLILILIYVFRKDKASSLNLPERL
jgi:putative tryptophan/tyrosine transport system permease protein